MKLLQRNKIDDDRWNELVIDSPHFRHYNLTYFLDACASDWMALVLNDYDAVWALPVKRFPLKRQFQPLLAQQMGPTFKHDPIPRFVEDGLDFITRHFWSSNIKFIDSLQLPQKFSFTEQLNVELALSTSYENLYRQYNRNARSNLKKACNNQLSVLEDAKAFSFVIDTFKRTGKSKIAELNHQFYKDVVSIYTAFERRKEASCYLAMLQGEPIAGLMTLQTGNRMLNFFTAASEKARNTGAMHFLIDHVIKQNAGTDMALDFEGSNDDNLRFFYKSFGGTEKVYLQHQNSRIFWPINKFIK